LFLLTIGENGDELPWKTAKPFGEPTTSKRKAFLDFIGESYRFRQRLRQEEQQDIEEKTEPGS
jgi:hypothetical protein